ncbi:MAG TPA: transcriptional regulator [Clostridia bacterium]|nr:transcriptional regulator [Clostridia bacterium]
MSKIDNYVNEVLDCIIADNDMKRRIASDLTLQLNEAARAEDIDDVLERMGTPKEVAKEFMDSIYENKSELFDEIIAERKQEAVFSKRVLEYKSKTTVMGIPLVHIKLSRYGKPAVAKGIIAIGTFSVGVISIGAIPVGLISIGGLALGVISLGGLAVGLLLAMGGVAIGALALGGIAVGLGAMGGVAVGEIAIGGVSRGTVAIGANPTGQYRLLTHHIGAETRSQVEELIRTAFPKLPDWIINLFKGLDITIGETR